MKIPRTTFRSWRALVVAAAVPVMIAAGAAPANAAELSPAGCTLAIVCPKPAPPAAPRSGTQPSTKDLIGCSAFGLGAAAIPALTAIEAATGPFGWIAAAGSCLYSFS